MFVVTAVIQVQREHVGAFIEASLGDAQGSVRDEPGCRRFDIVQDNQDDARFLLYEVYDDRAAFDHHLTTPHFHRWYEAIKDWLAEPLQPMMGRAVFLTEDAPARTL